MSWTDVAPGRMGSLGTGAAPSAIAGWIGAALRGVLNGSATVPPVRDRVREAAKLRTWAIEVQRTDHRFAEDLFAAADRHERAGS